VNHRRRQRARHHESAEREHGGGHGPRIDHPLVPKGDHEVLADASAVRDFAEHARAEGLMAFDTEFIGEESFRPRICLVQVSTTSRVALIDPLSAVDPRPIYEVVADPAVRTIVHAGEQDIGAVRDALGMSVANLVDTQIAVSLLGLPWPSSLGTMLEQFTGLRLGKAHTFTEWDRRPLTESQLHYAADDVRYLPMAWEAVRAQLEARGRLGWAVQESEEQLAGESEFDPDRQMRRASRGENLRPAATTLLRELVLLRREIARETDQPQRVAIPDVALMELVRRKPERADAVREIRFLPKPVAGRFGDRIAECVQKARDLPPTRDEHARLLEDAAVRARIDSMWLALQVRCAAQDLAPNLLCSRSEFTDWCAARIAQERRRKRGETVAEAPPAPFPPDDWRTAAAGAWLQDFVEGRGSLQVRWDLEAGAIRPID
jgi:ribonuclease D